MHLECAQPARDGPSGDGPGAEDVEPGEVVDEAEPVRVDVQLPHHGLVVVVQRGGPPVHLEVELAQQERGAQKLHEQPGGSLGNRESWY